MAGIEISGIEKLFGDFQALRGVSLSMAPGEFLALVGPSGCGKTTLMRIVAGIERQDRGTIAIGRRDVGGLRAADRDVPMVFQSYALYPHLTVAENIAVPLTLRRLSTWQRMPLLGRAWPGSRATRAGIVADAAQAAQSLGLGAMLGRWPAQLSGGHRQRVARARAIVRSSSAFLMDEPLSNLDAALRVQTRREIVDIHRRVGATTLYVTHDQSEALTMADRVAVMLAVEILQIDTPTRIYNDPADLRVATFIGSPRINTLPAELRADGMVPGGRVADGAAGGRCGRRGHAGPAPRGSGARRAGPAAGHRGASGVPRRKHAAACAGCRARHADDAAPAARRDCARRRFTGSPSIPARWACS